MVQNADSLSVSERWIMNQSRFVGIKVRGAYHPKRIQREERQQQDLRAPVQPPRREHPRRRA